MTAPTHPPAPPPTPPSLPTALTGKTALIVINVTLTGGQIKDDLKALGWEGFTADVDQRWQVAATAAAAGNCDPNGVTQSGWYVDPRPPGPRPVQCNGCEREYEGNYHAGCGCYNGYCWSTCSHFLLGVYSHNNADWCYTNHPGGYSQDFNYKKCTKNSDCSHEDVHCAGSCTM